MEGIAAHLQRRMRLLIMEMMGRIKAHDNLAFEVSISKGVLEPGKHSAVSFKDNPHKKIGKFN